MAFDMKTAIVCAIIGALVGGAAAYALFTYVPASDERMITEFYATEHAVSVSPADYITHLKNGKIDGLVVDLRSSGEYAKAHLVTAVNVPSVEMTGPQLLAAFEKLPKDKPIITYCYTSYCMLSRNVGNYLAQRGFMTKHLTAGWYEINRDFSQYVVNGTAPGVLNENATYGSTLCERGEFDC